MEVFLILSCSSESSTEISADLSARLSVKLNITGIALEYLMDLASIQLEEGQDLPESLFIPEDINAYFRALPGVEAERIELNGPGGLELDLTFFNINDFFEHQEYTNVSMADGSLLNSTPVVSIDRKSFHFDLTRENVYQIASLLPLGDDPVSQSGMMLFENHGSKEDFREMILWLFEEYSSEDAITRSLESSLMEFSFSLPWNVSSTNMDTLDSGKFSFSIPVIDFFTLEEPLLYYAHFQ